MLGFVAEVGIDTGTDGGGAVYAFKLRKHVSSQVQTIRPEMKISLKEKGSEGGGYEIGGNFLTRESEALDRVALLLKVLAEALALGGFAGAVQTFNNNQGSTSGFRHGILDEHELSIYAM